MILTSILKRIKIMDKILSYAMFGFSVVTLVLAINVLRSSGKNHKGNFLFIGLALSSSLWGVCFGLYQYRNPQILHIY